jgi:hypothetical protein
LDHRTNFSIAPTRIFPSQPPHNYQSSKSRAASTYQQSALATSCELPLRHQPNYRLAPTVAMPRLIFSNPFKKHDASEFPDVVIPLGQAPRQPSVNSNEKPDDTSRASSDAVQSGGVRTLESLRAEIDSDTTADTAYDRKSKVINKALADMGMGRYQWSLFVLCGFGWLADKYVFSEAVQMP